MESPIIEIDIGQLSPDPSQPRKVFDENAINSLREDIKANGLKEAIDINPLLDGRTTKYLIIDGECRFHAIEGIDDFGMVPCKLHAYKSQREIDKHRASKHFHRKDWNPGDRAEWLKYYMTTHKLRQQDLAREFSIRQSTVSEWLAPASDGKVLKALRNEEIGFKQAVLLSRVDDAETRENALRDAIGKTQKQTEEIIAARYSEPETEKEEEESESEITDREGLIKSVPEDLQERLLDATKDLSLHDTERIVKQINMGVRIDEAIRAVKLSRTPELQVTEAEVKERFAQGDESQLPQVEGHSPSASETVNDGEGGSTEEALLSSETSNIIDRGFEIGREKGIEEPTDSELPSDSPLIEAQSPLPEEGTVITPDVVPSPETKKKEPQVCAKVSNMEEMLQKLVNKPPKTFLATFKTTSHKGNFKNRVEGIHLWSGELVDLMESDLNGKSLFICEVKRKRKALMDILKRPKHSIIKSEKIKLDDLMDELKTKIEQDAKRGG